METICVAGINGWWGWLSVLSRSDLISIAVTLVAVAISFLVGGLIAAFVCLGFGVLILIVAQFMKERSRPKGPPESRPTAEPNLVLMKPDIGTLYLVGDIWARKLPEGAHPSFGRYQAILAEITNAPKEEGEVGPISSIRAELVVGDEEFTPLPWLDEYLSTVSFKSGQVKEVILAVEMPTQSLALGDWRVVRNRRTGQDVPAGASSMDFEGCLKRVAPESRVKLNLLHVTSGKVLRSFEGVCQWKDGYAIPIISFK